jgi:hypothetical protein
MSDLKSFEKSKLEKFFGMSSGYVLTFSNRTFAEFVFENSGLDIYDERYNRGTGSKAQRLRAFWEKEPNAVVAKLLDALIEYDGGGTPEEIKNCRQITERLRASQAPEIRPAPMHQTANQANQPPSASDLSHLMQDFVRISTGTDRNKAGYDLEKLLNRLFELFQLKPRQPFKVTGEQIDGSFELDTHIYLLESKWEKRPLPEADLLVFKGKIEGKSKFTRGVFVALNGVSEPARDAITRGKTAPFFVMTGHDLCMILEGSISLIDFLRKRVRLLCEEGAVCVPFSDLGD